MDLDKLRNWLRSYYGWGDITLIGSVELLPLDCQELWRKVDIVGNLRIGVRHRFVLSWRAAGSREVNDRLVLDFQGWVQRQSEMKYAPHFGDEPALSRIQSLQGTLKENAQVYTYTATLAVDFVKAYAT